MTFEERVIVPRQITVPQPLLVLLQQIDKLRRKAQDPLVRDPHGFELGQCEETPFHGGQVFPREPRGHAKKLNRRQNS